MHYLVPESSFNIITGGRVRVREGVIKPSHKKKNDFNILFKFVQGNLAHIYLLAANNEIFYLGSYIYLLTNEIKIKINILFFDRIRGPE